MFIVTYAVLIASLLSNICLGIVLLRKSKVKQKPDYTAKRLLKDLLNGGALINIDVVDLDSIFLRSPKDMI